VPCYMRPGLRAPVWLDADKDITPRPTFYSKALTMDGQLKIAGVLDRLTTDPDVTTEQLFDDACEALAEVIDSWDNMQEPFSFRMLSYNEARELLRKVAYAQGLTFEEKKS
jgi:hypothetical protein